MNIIIASGTSCTLHPLLLGDEDEEELLSDGEPIVDSCLYEAISPSQEYFTETLVGIFNRGIDPQDENEAVALLRSYFQDLRESYENGEPTELPGSYLTAFIEDLLCIGQLYGKTGTLDGNVAGVMLSLQP